MPSTRSRVAIGVLLIAILGWLFYQDRAHLYDEIDTLESTAQDAAIRTAERGAVIDRLADEVDQLGGDSSEIVDNEDLSTPVVLPGERGPQGEQGERGSQGPQGEPGAPAPAPTQAQVDAAIRLLCSLEVDRCRETQDPEVQDPEVQDPEFDDPEPDDPELDDGDPDDPEVQDPEIQDPEIDDPDPGTSPEALAAAVDAWLQANLPSLLQAAVDQWFATHTFTCERDTGQTFICRVTG